MNSLIKQIKSIQKTGVSQIVNTRLKEFSSFKHKDTKHWFAELCFCLLTANSKARTALQIQKELGCEGFCSFSQNKIRNCIIKNKHRFHNNKTKFIMEARKKIDIKDKLQKIITENDEKAARAWLAENIKGLGYKEASHFLRNVGYKNLAIVDRHIINTLVDNKLIDRPKTISKRLYLEIEDILDKISQSVGMTQAELDLYLWYLKTGEVLK